MKLKHTIDYFFKYAIEQRNPYNSFPLTTEADEFGGPYIEISDSGKLAIVARDRGYEVLRKETTSPDELAKWVYEMFNKG